VTAYGPQPLTYQWYFNDGALTGATGTNYTLTGVTAMNGGNYTVVVSNPVGSVTSSVARLTHISLPPGYNQMGRLLLSAGDMRLSFVGIPGWNYALDRSFSLSPAD
jgi:hypothetical protein